MSTRKGIVIGTLGLVLLISSGMAARYHAELRTVWKVYARKTPSYAKFLPSEPLVVARVNLARLAFEAGHRPWGDPPEVRVAAAALKKLYPEAERLLADPAGHTGLDLAQDVYVFAEELGPNVQTTGVLFGVRDPAGFRRFLKTVGLDDAREVLGFHAVGKPKDFVVYWNDAVGLACVSADGDAAQAAEAILGRKGEGLGGNRPMADRLAEKSDVVAVLNIARLGRPWLASRFGDRRAELWAQDAEGALVTLAADFEAGRMVLRSAVSGRRLLTESGADLLAPPGKEFIENLPFEPLSLLLTGRVPLAALLKKFPGLEPIEEVRHGLAKDFGASLDDVVQALTGDFAVMGHGFRPPPSGSDASAFPPGRLLRASLVLGVQKQAVLSDLLGKMEASDRRLFERRGKILSLASGDVPVVIGLGPRYLAASTLQGIARQAAGDEPQKTAFLPAEVRAEAEQSLLFLSVEPGRVREAVLAAGLNRGAPPELRRTASLLADKVSRITFRSSRETDAVSADLTVWCSNSGENVLRQALRVAAELSGPPKGP